MDGSSPKSTLLMMTYKDRNMHHCHLFFVIQSSQGLPLQICQAKGNDSITALSIPG